MGNNKNEWPLNRTLFCNVSWMKYYNGTTVNDKPYGGTEYVKTTKDAYEKINFKNFDGEYQYGFIETMHPKDSTNFETDYKKFNLSNFVNEYNGEDNISGILVIFFARNPHNNDNFEIIGYYKNATIYKIRQFTPTGEMYNLSCKKEDAALVEHTKRLPLNLPRGVQIFHRQLFIYPHHKKEYFDIYSNIINNVLSFDTSNDYHYLQLKSNTWIVPINRKKCKEVIDTLLSEERIKLIQIDPNILPGDVLFLYFPSPYQAYKFKVVALKANEIDKATNDRYMEVELIARGNLSFEEVKNNVPDVSVEPQTQRQLSGNILNYLENNFVIVEEDYNPSLADLDDEIDDSYDDIIDDSKPAEEKIQGERTYLPRNERVKRIALSRSEGKCANKHCNHELFKNRSGMIYLEAHHIIPLAAYKDFPNINIDIPDNVICLCPSCHREIHNGKNASILIKEIYEERKELLKSHGIVLQDDIATLMEYYGVGKEELEND